MEAAASRRDVRRKRGRIVVSVGGLSEDDR